MPFKSDKQRRFLWSQKPEVAKQIAYKQSGGGVYSSGLYDDAAKWHNARLAGVPQHVGFVDDPDDITETALTNPDDPYGGKYINPDRKAPLGRYTDLATYYTAKDRKMGRGEAELARMNEANKRLREEAKRRGFVNEDGTLNFQHGGEVPMTDGRKPKKVTQKDRYGNSTTVEYESDTKPLDINSLVEMLFDKDISAGVPVSNVPVLGDVSFGFAEAHPGAPKGSDTVPAWLTPGEFVVNREAMSDPAMAKTVEAINDKGRMMQQGGYAQPSFQEWLRDTGYDEELARGTVSQQGALLDYYDEFGAPPPVPKAPAPEAPAPVKSAVEAAAAPRPRPQTQGGVDWNVPLGSLGGIDFSTQGSYTAMDQAKDPYKVGLRAALKFNEGGPVYMDEGGLLKNLWWLARNQDKVKAAQEAKAARAARKQAEAPQPTWADLQSMIQGAVQHKQEGGDIPVPMSPTEALLRAREGYRSDVYLDSEGKPTVGHGHLLPNEYISREGERPFSEEQLGDWFREDQAAAASAAQRNAKHYGVDWDKLNKREKTALESMAFQLGETGQKDFEKMWKALAAGDKETAALEALDSNWASQTPERAKDVYSALTPNLGFEKGGPVYAYRGYDVAEQDAYDIEDPNTDLSSGWEPGFSVDGGASQWDAGDEALMQNYEMLDPPAPALGELSATDEALGPVPPAAGMAMPDESSGEIPEGGGDFWSGIGDFITDTSAADARNASFNKKVAEANLESAQETVAELEQRAKDGQPVNSQTLEGAKAAVEHQEEQVDEARLEHILQNSEIDAEGVVAAEAALMAQQAEGKEDDKARLEEVMNDPLMQEADAPDVESEKGTQSTGEVVTAGEQAAQEDPDKLEVAKGFFKDAFSDLFDGKELARMAIMYMGSRALGYDHNGSLRWSVKQYSQRLDAKDAANTKVKNELIKSGKYTPASIEKYLKSGDASALRQAGGSYIPTGNTRTVNIDGKKVGLVEVKGPDKGTYYQDTHGNTIKPSVVAGMSDWEPSFEKGTPEYRARRSRATSDAAGRFEEVFKTEDTEPGGGGKPDKHWTKIRPKQAADEFWSWSEKMGLDPESDEALGIMTLAYREAIKDGRAPNDVTPTSLKPYLEAQYIREKVGAPELFMTNPDREDGVEPQYVRGDIMAGINREVTDIATDLPKLRGLDPKTASSQFYDNALAEWNKLDNDLQKLHMKSAKETGHSGFSYWLQQKRIPQLRAALAQRGG